MGDGREASNKTANAVQDAARLFRTEVTQKETDLG
jgi:hypothetical protein